MRIHDSHDVSMLPSQTLPSTILNSSEAFLCKPSAFDSSGILQGNKVYILSIESIWACIIAKFNIYSPV